MNVRVFNQKFLEPGAQVCMVLGIIFLCQPWILGLHQWSVALMLLGLIGFNVAVHIPPPEPTKLDEDDTGPVSVTEAVRGGSHG